MGQPTFLVRQRGWDVLLKSLAISVLIWPSISARADEFEKLDSAIKHVPADSVFFHSFIRNREQVEAIIKSKTFARFLQLPYVQMAKDAFLKVWFDPESPFWELRLQLGLKENQELLELAKDLLSNEIFIYGGAKLCAFKDV